MDIQRGDAIIVRDAFGSDLTRRACSGVDPGDEFAVIWACREDEWIAAETEEREPNCTPWPVEDVRVAEREPA